MVMRFKPLLREQSPIDPYNLIRNIAGLNPAKKGTLVSNSRVKKPSPAYVNYTRLLSQVRES